MQSVRLIRRQYPQARILARARDRHQAWRLMDLGTEPYRELLGTSLEVADRVLRELGVPAAAAAEHIRCFREHDEALLQEQYLVYDDEAALKRSTRQARAELVRPFEADAEDPAVAGAAEGTEGTTQARPPGAATSSPPAPAGRTAARRVEGAG